MKDRISKRLSLVTPPFPVCSALWGSGINGKSKQSERGVKTGINVLKRVGKSGEGRHWRAGHSNVQGRSGG